MQCFRNVLPLTVMLGLCACNANAVPHSPNGTEPLRILSTAARWAPFSQPTGHSAKSWLSPELRRLAAAPLLFVSDSGTAEVYIYKLANLKLMGTITGFSEPQGLCSDTKGNVWITDTIGQKIYELTHRGRLENELTDKSGYPVACAWDKKTGNLAVMNIFSTGSVAGEVLIFKKGSSTGTAYQNSQQYYYNFGSYDSSGNLFFDGRTPDGTFMLSELPRGAASANTVTLSDGTIYFPGMVQWDPVNHDLIIGDQSCGNSYTSCVYSVTVSQSSGTIGTQTSLQNYAGGQVCDLVQGAELNGTIAGSDFNFCGTAASATYAWPYPGGGAPSVYTKRSDSIPVGAAISR